MKKIPVTPAGVKQLEAELHDLKTTQRPNIIAAIAEARAHGDLKENAEYHAAKEQQGFIEGRIAEVEGKLSNCQIIDVTKLTNDGRVVFGTTVHLVNVDTDQEVIYQVVGDDEADIKQAKISVNSPIARAIIGKQVGEVVGVQAPSGLLEYEISKVEYI